MLYQFRSAAQKLALYPLSSALEKSQGLVQHPANPFKNTIVGRFQTASLETSQRLVKPYPKQPYTLDSTHVDGVDIEVEQQVFSRKAFADLLRFKRKGSDNDPKVLFVAAMSGHYATLSQDTYREFLPDHDVYVTDWKSARDVPLSEGRFGFEEYVAYVMEFIRELGPNTHVIGLCQASVPVLCAIALMAEDDERSQPASMTLMAGPVDARINPAKFVKFFNDYVPLKVLHANVRKVPSGFKGAGRKVYPGYLQLMGFMVLNPKLHVQKHKDFFMDVLHGRDNSADYHREFYDEYLSGLDGTAEFFLETLERVFTNYDLPEGRMKYGDRTVDCGKITKTALLTVEGEKDNMCQLEQTEAAHDLCTNIPNAMHDHHIQAGVGHYGVFNSSIYRAEIAPHIKRFIANNSVSAQKIAD